MTVGEKIRYRRLELNMTMEELGKAIGVQRSAINKYEKGIVDIKSSTLSAIAKALGVSLIYFLDDEKEPHRPIVFSDIKEFTKLLAAMSPEDYGMVVAAIDRTYKKMREEGKL